MYSMFNLFNVMFLCSHKICENMNSVQQQCEGHHQKELIESFHLSGHTLRFFQTVQDVEVFCFKSNSYLAVKGLDAWITVVTNLNIINKYCIMLFLVLFSPLKIFSFMTSWEKFGQDLCETKGTDLQYSSYNSRYFLS